MAGGIHAKTPTGYLETEYFQPWPGIDVSKPSSQIDPGACVSISGMSIRGGLTNQPAIVIPTGSAYPIFPPTLQAGEVIALVTNLQGITILMTNFGVYSDFSASNATSKTFSLFYTFLNPYTQAVRFGSVVIGSSLYFSSAEQLGIYQVAFTHSIAGLYVTNAGSGYGSAPTVTISGGGGSGATATASISAPATGQVTSYSIPGPPPQVSGYHWLPTPTVTVTVTGGGGTGATAVANLATYGAGSSQVYYIASITPTAFGSGYTSAPTVTITYTGTLVNPPIPPVTAYVSGAGSSVTALNLTAGGSGYTSLPTVTISAPGSGVTATGAAVLGSSTGLSVSEITAHNGSGPYIGANFLGTISQRLVVGNIIGGDGNQSGVVQSVAVVSGGTGYPNSGTVSFTGGGGENASGTFAASAGVITSVAVTNGGIGYNSAPTVNIIAASGSGFSGTTTLSFAIGQSSTTAYPDYVAWSFPNAYGYFDPNNISLAGGFDQLTEARGKITGLAFFESVWFAAHLGGFTQITPNTSGSNISPWTYNPNWSSDQGVICRLGSLAQYGSMCMFLGLDQPYQLSPMGLNPVGDTVAPLLQDFSLWKNGANPDAGLYGSIVEIEGEKHYLIAFSSDDPLFTNNALRSTTVYDGNLRTGAWFTWNYPGLTTTCPIYQSYDNQIMQGTRSSFLIDRDNLLLAGFSTTSAGVIRSVLGQAVAGTQLYASGLYTIYGPTAFTFQFRSENPAVGRAQSSRGVYIEYENLPNLVATPPTITFTLSGQPEPSGNGTSSPPVNVQFSVTLPYYALSSSVPPNAVLTAYCQPAGTALTATSQTLSGSVSGFLRLIKIDQYGETTQGTLQ